MSDGASDEALEDLRDSLKVGIKAVWSQEAVRRGVAAAKVLFLYTVCWISEQRRGNTDAIS